MVYEKRREDMREHWTRGLFTTILLGLVCMLGLAEAVAQSALDVTLTGKFLTDQEKGNADTYLFYVRGKRLRFELKHIEVPAVAPESASGQETMVDIGSARIQLIGSENVIKQLQQPDILGKPVKIKGTLYVADAILVVNSVQ